MDAASLSLLHRLTAMGASSLLQYVSESFPWTAEKSHGTLTQVMAIAKEESEAAAQLVRVLQKKHLRMRVQASYPSHFTTTNFVSVDYLLPKLIAEHGKEVAEIEGKLPAVKDDEARTLAQAYLDMKRGHLEALKKCADHG